GQERNEPGRPGVGCLMILVGLIAAALVVATFVNSTPAETARVGQGVVSLTALGGLVGAGLVIAGFIVSRGQPLEYNVRQYYRCNICGYRFFRTGGQDN